jgi:hypothetical protein
MGSRRRKGRGRRAEGELEDGNVQSPASVAADLKGKARTM